MKSERCCVKNCRNKAVEFRRFWLHPFMCWHFVEVGFCRKHKKEGK